MVGVLEQVTVCFEDFLVIFSVAVFLFSYFPERVSGLNGVGFGCDSGWLRFCFGSNFGGNFGGGLPKKKKRETVPEDWEESFSDDDLNQDLPRFVKGERVVHATFGSGTVLEISGFGSDLKVTVDFDTVGRKKLLARYADLEKDYL